MGKKDANQEHYQVKEAKKKVQYETALHEVRCK